MNDNDYHPASQRSRGAGGGKRCRNAITQLKEDDYGRYKMLQEVLPPHQIVPEAFPEGGRVIAIVDVETTGFDVEQDKIIELAIMLMIVDADDRVIGVMPPRSWLEDPKQPLDPRIGMITGITDADLAGKKIDDRQALAMLNRASVVVAHNASFDSAFIEKRLPAAAGKAWACSCHQIDWPGLGFDSRVQGYLLMQTGWFNTAHRAAADVWSLYWLLITWHGETTLLQRLLATSDQPTVRIDVSRSYRQRGDLKRRGYRWDNDRKAWWIEVVDDQSEAELAALEALGIFGTTLTTMTATERHRPLKVKPADPDAPFDPGF